MKKLNNVFLREIGALARTIHYANDIEFKKYNLQKGQFTFLTRVCENPGISFSHLANILHVDKTTATKAIGKLITAGYVQKKQSETDKREYHIIPTTKAYEVYDLIISKENKDIATCFETLDDNEQKQLLILMGKINQNVEALWQNRKGDIKNAKSK